MSGFSHRIAVSLLALAIGAPWLFAQQTTKPAATKKKPPAAIAAEQRPVQPQTDLPPSPPPTPEQMPPSAPQVTYGNGLLSIVARNSTLRDVLAAVRARTGMVIEGASDSAFERVAVQLGPAPVEDVLRSLLQGSRFDYVILGSESRPGAVERIILTARQGGAGAPASVAGGNAPSPAQTAPAQPNTAEENPEEVDEESEPAPMEQPAQVAPGTQQPLPQPGIPPQQQGAPGQPGYPGAAVTPEHQTPSPEPNQQAPDAQQQQQQQQPKTPEQLLRELQQMQQREREQQQQQQQSQPPE